MASESNRVVVGNKVINLDHVLYVTRDARGVIIHFATPILSARGLASQGHGSQTPYELRLQGKAGQQFWQYYLSGASSVEVDKLLMIDAPKG